MLVLDLNALLQVQQWSGVWSCGHGGICGAADKDPAADARSDDLRQPADGKSTGAASGGTYTRITAPELYELLQLVK